MFTKVQISQDQIKHRSKTIKKKRHQVVWLFQKNIRKAESTSPNSQIR